MSLIDTDAIVRAIVTNAQAAMPSDVQVLDGRDYSVELEKRAVIVGYSGSPEAPTVEVTRSPDAGSLDDSRYLVTVRGTVGQWDGEMEFPVKRAGVQAVLTKLDAAIAADRSLGGTVFDSWLSPTLSWYQLPTEAGTAIEVDFTVTVEVYA